MAGIVRDNFAETDALSGIKYPIECGSLRAGRSKRKMVAKRNYRIIRYPPSVVVTGTPALTIGADAAC